jgi:hypothetical protein
MTETFKQYIGGLVKAAAIAASSTAHPRLYYLVRYYPHAVQHDYYLVRSGNTRVELPGYRGPDAQWTWDECEQVDPGYKYKRVLVEE